MQLLIVVLSKSEFHLHLRNMESNSDHLIIGKDNFYIEELSHICEGLMGFFDWLRIDARTICGVRMSFFINSEYYPQIKNKFSYLIFNDEYNSVTIKFNECLFVRDISDDKDFTHNFIYYTNDGKIAITFPLDSLSIDELESIKAFIS